MQAARQAAEAKAKEQVAALKNRMTEGFSQVQGDITPICSETAAITTADQGVEEGLRSSEQRHNAAEERHAGVQSQILEMLRDIKGTLPQQSVAQPGFTIPLPPRPPPPAQTTSSSPPGALPGASVAPKAGVPRALEQHHAPVKETGPGALVASDGESKNKHQEEMTLGHPRDR